MSFLLHHLLFIKLSKSSSSFEWLCYEMHLENQSINQIILLIVAIVLLCCLVDWLWDLLLMVTLLFLVIGLTGVWDLLRWRVPAVGMLCLWFEVFLFWFRYFCKIARHSKTHLFGLAYSRQGTHFWVCNTFCRVRHGVSVTKPDYYYYYYYYLYRYFSCRDDFCVVSYRF